MLSAQLRQFLSHDRNLSAGAQNQPPRGRLKIGQFEEITDYPVLLSCTQRDGSTYGEPTQNGAKRSNAQSTSPRTAYPAYCQGVRHSPGDRRPAYSMPSTTVKTGQGAHWHQPVFNHQASQPLRALATAHFQQAGGWPHRPADLPAIMALLANIPACVALYDVWSTLMNTTSACFLCNSFRCGMHLMHGTHSVPENSTT
jgi:hypothetical protein